MRRHRRDSAKSRRPSKEMPRRRLTTSMTVPVWTASPTTPGSKSRRWAGPPACTRARYATDGHDFAANNRLLLKNLQGVGNRRARFRTVIALILNGEEHLFEGVVEGRIIDHETGHEGFGFDPLFRPRRLRTHLCRNERRGEKRYLTPRTRCTQTGRIPPRTRKIEVAGMKPKEIIRWGILGVR